MKFQLNLGIQSTTGALEALSAPYTRKYMHSRSLHLTMKPVIEPAMKPVIELVIELVIKPVAWGIDLVDVNMLLR